MAWRCCYTCCRSACLHADQASGCWWSADRSTAPVLCRMTTSDRVVEARLAWRRGRTSTRSGARVTDAGASVGPTESDGSQPCPAAFRSERRTSARPGVGLKAGTVHAYAEMIARSCRASDPETLVRRLRRTGSHGAWSSRMLSVWFLPSVEPSVRPGRRSPECAVR